MWLLHAMSQGYQHSRLLCCLQRGYAHSWFTGLSQYFTASAVRTSEPKLVSNCVKCGKCARHCPQHIDIPERLDDVRRRFQPGPVTAMLKVFGKTRSS